MSLPTVSGQIRNTGLGDNSRVIENSIMNSQPAGGYPEDTFIPLRDWSSTTGLTLTATSGATPFMAMASTNLPVITWRQDATTTDLIRFSYMVPRHYEAGVDQLYLNLVLRKFDTLDTDENADLMLSCMVRQILPGTVNPALASTTVPATTNLIAGENALTAFDAVVNRTLPAASSALSAFAVYQFDLGADRRNTALDRTTITEALKIKPGDLLMIELFPHEPVGSTDMAIQMAASTITHMRNACFNNRDRREQLDGGLLTQPGPYTLTTTHHFR